MKKTMELLKPVVTLSGDTLSELSFDFDTLTPADYRQITRLEAKLRGAQVSMEYSPSKSTSSEFRMATAWVAAVKGTKGLCFDDYERLNMLDLLSLEEWGLLFIGRCLE